MSEEAVFKKDGIIYEARDNVEMGRYKKGEKVLVGRSYGEKGQTVGVTIMEGESRGMVFHLKRNELTFL